MNDILLPSKIACSSCRRKRVKCDKQRPLCSRCYKGGSECHYQEPKKTGPKPKIPDMFQILDNNLDFVMKDTGLSLSTTGSEVDTETPLSAYSDTDIQAGLSAEEVFALFFNENAHISQILLRPKFERNFYRGVFVYGVLETLMRALVYRQHPKYEQIADHFYLEALQGLDSIERTTDRSPQSIHASMNSVAYLQAWLLICEYECHTLRFRSCSINIARCKRLAQQMNLDLIDSKVRFSWRGVLLEDVGSIDGEDGSFPEWSLIEEKRRTFWYVFMVGQCPAEVASAFVIEYIHTKMPMTYSSFSTARHAERGFMGAALESLRRGETIPDLDEFSALVLQMGVVQHVCDWNRSFEIEPMRESLDADYLEALKKKAAGFENSLNSLHSVTISDGPGGHLLNLNRVVGALCTYHHLYEHLYQQISFGGSKQLSPAITDSFDYYRKKNLIYLYLLIDICNDVQTSRLLKCNPLFTLLLNAGIQCTVGIVDKIMTMKPEFRLPKENIEGFVQRLQQTAESLRDSTKRLDLNVNDYFSDGFKDALEELEELWESGCDWTRVIM
ncbi:unnamed protein product [Kuraishia capsulata CBS 1993]|uniref:Zn(2)-C6 fungal-type domain-containing protein n=1 Tax=Kuraishia capsulata CBS 1993 TaxID=1382522 RepID=W6MXC3_9ASCO|nr:uncharacterized protein KUCA_T00004624001 [Kuraishia capsulata CBS 1993]CDK28640.1 unnamed protein product [Kuraishia capsulata CBS 1993]